jgi:hypothetical protein
MPTFRAFLQVLAQRHMALEVIHLTKGVFPEALEDALMLQSVHVSRGEQAVT